MSDKPFKTHDELIALLISRNIDISTPEQKSFAKKALQHEGYYDNYMLYNNFDTNKRDADQNIATVISEFQKQIASRAPQIICNK